MHLDFCTFSVIFAVCDHEKRLDIYKSRKFSLLHFSLATHLVILLCLILLMVFTGSVTHSYATSYTDSPPPI